MKRTPIDIPKASKEVTCDIKKLPISDEAKRRLEAGFLLDSGALNSRHPRMTADANGLCRLCGYDLGGGVVCCQSLDDYDECSLAKPGCV